MIRFLRGSVLAAIPLVLLAVPLIAQRSQQRTNGTEIQVHITYENSQPVDLQLRVDLTNGSGIVVTQAFTTNDGRVNFRVSSEGIYLVKVSGTDIEDGASESVEVDPLDSVRVVFVRVRRKAEAAGAQSSASSPNVRMTSAAELRAPQNARKAFDQRRQDRRVQPAQLLALGRQPFLEAITVGKLQPGEEVAAEPCRRPAEVVERHRGLAQ